MTWLKHGSKRKIDNTYSLIIPGKPMGKQRPRFSSFGKFTKVYTPKETLDKEKEIKKLFLQKYPKHDTIESAIKVEVIAYMYIPKSTSKKKKQMMLNDDIKSIIKPDVDNIAKLILDALNGLAFKDDKQIVELVCYKRYSDEPRSEITIERI